MVAVDSLKIDSLKFVGSLQVVSINQVMPKVQKEQSSKDTPEFNYRGEEM